MFGFNPAVLARLALAAMAMALTLLFGKPAGSVEGRPVCMPRLVMLQSLLAAHGQVIVVRAALGESMAEWTANAKTGSWSMVLTGKSPDGTLMSCLMMNGEHWHPIEPET
jgi:hypothetical protein